MNDHKQENPDILSDKLQESSQNEHSESDKIDFDKLNSALKIQFSSPDLSRDNRKNMDILELIEEITEDVFDISRRLKAAEDTQTQLISRLNDIDKLIRDNNQASARELLNLRRDILGEHKALIAISAFNSVVSIIDSIRAMKLGLNQKRDKRLLRQLSAIESSLSTVIQGLGIHEFSVNKGDKFDPSRMECVGFGNGAPGIVLKFVRSGYIANGIVVRAAGVITADPNQVTLN